MKKFSVSLLIQALFASCLSLVPVLLTSEHAFAGTLETLKFSRNKVASIYDAQGQAPLDCYKSSGTCGGTKTATFEQTLPSGGYFKLFDNVTDLKNRIGFLDMTELIERTMEKIPFIAQPSLDDYFESDGEARSFAASLIHL